MNLLPFVENSSLPLTAEEAEAFGRLIVQTFVDARADLVSRVPGARHITDTHSGHYIHIEQPQLVIDAVREVVEAARKKSCALGVKNHGQCVKAEKQARRWKNDQALSKLSAFSNRRSAKKLKAEGR